VSDFSASRLSARFSPSQTAQEEISRVWLKSQTGQFRLSEKCGEHLGHSHYYLVEVGPGLFSGEEHRIDLEVTAGHRVSITQQSATKVMPALDSNFAVMELELTANQGSSLIFLSEPTIMLPSAALSSGTTIHVDGEAKLLFTEIVGDPPGLKERPGYPSFLSTQLRILCDDC
jgi:urease accessory protein UreH